MWAPRVPVFPVYSWAPMSHRWSDLCWGAVCMQTIWNGGTFICVMSQPARVRFCSPWERPSLSTIVMSLRSAFPSSQHAWPVERVDGQHFQWHCNRREEVRRLTQMPPPQTDRVSQSPCLYNFHQNLTPCPAGWFKVIPQSYHEQDRGQRIQPAGGKVLATLILTVLVWLLHGPLSTIYYHFFHLWVSSLEKMSQSPTVGSLSQRPPHCAF